MTRRRTGRRTGRSPVHVVVTWVRQFVDAIRHVRTGGASTRRRARKRAADPPQRCSKCHQPIPHSADWRDHLDERHPEWVRPHRPGADQR